MTAPFRLSICIVAYQSREYLRGCLRSIAEHTHLPYEILVADNGSTDGTAAMIAEEFPQVRFLAGTANEGFSRPMNRALRAARGEYLVLLNPDTVVLDEAFDRLAAFMEAHPQVGICGPKVLNPDGTLQGPCRRGESRPWAVLSYFLGLYRLFPRSRRFGGYLLNYLDEDEIAEVDGVSGSCMMIRRALIEEIGYLDERFFAYQEDADYCFRARQAGWKVYYVPTAQIIHYGGQGGSHAVPWRAILAWHHSYWLYYRKNLARDYFFLFNWLYYGLMVAKLMLTLLLNLLRREKNPGHGRR